MNKTKVLWSCRECGHSQPKWTGSCSSCQNWNTLVEEVSVEEKKPRFETKRKESAKPVRIRDVQTDESKRLVTKMGELDRLFGGGIVGGSLILVGGEPGVGKSTLLLQIANALASQNLTVLYVCGEESAEQTSLRARRLGIDHPNLYLLSETMFSSIRIQIDKLQARYRDCRFGPDRLQIGNPFLSRFSCASARDRNRIHALGQRGRNHDFFDWPRDKIRRIRGSSRFGTSRRHGLDFEGDRQHGYRLLARDQKPVWSHR